MLTEITQRHYVCDCKRQIHNYQHACIINLWVNCENLNFNSSGFGSDPHLHWGVIFGTTTAASPRK